MEPRAGSEEMAGRGASPRAQVEVSTAPRSCNDALRAALAAIAINAETHDAVLPAPAAPMRLMTQEGRQRQGFRTALPLRSTDRRPYDPRRPTLRQ
jgi:hypothetical protein